MHLEVGNAANAAQALFFVALWPIERVTANICFLAGSLQGYLDDNLTNPFGQEHQPQPQIKKPTASAQLVEEAKAHNTF